MGFETENEVAVMTPEMILTILVLAVVVVLFIFEWVRVDVVGIMMMVILSDLNNVPTAS